MAAPGAGAGRQRRRRHAGRHGTNDGAIAVCIAGAAPRGDPGGNERGGDAAAAWAAGAGTRTAVSNESVSRPLGSGDDDDANATEAVSNSAIANNTWPG
ncbi:hypothetical protein BURCENBC7_AP5065 [Burkholderia cenocepacia BC7]|nr:hypothetical protein BURCENBC7_AP5065 [Burkholderia cenocepacia BC7]